MSDGGYAAIYWAAACLTFMAGRGMTDGQLSSAVEMVCKDAGLGVAHEATLRELISKFGK